MKKSKDIRDDIKKLRANRQFLMILILLFISVIFWITISLITSQSRKEISKELTDLALPLVPNLDKETLSKIEAKRSYSESELSSFTIYKILTTRDGKNERVVPLEVTVDDIDPKPTPQPTVVPTASPDSSPSATLSPETEDNSTEESSSNLEENDQNSNNNDSNSTGAENNEVPVPI